MTPTNELRWIWQKPPTWPIDKEERVLQQKWQVQDGNYPKYEWRDVPLVKEEA